ncbi:YcnI family copper-binding membrane protein [Mycobacterium sp. C31M]
MSINRTRLAAIGTTLAVAGVLAAAPAAAHVRVDEGQSPARGGYGIVALIVPTESADASTVELSIEVPDEVDLLSARTLPIPGWTASVETEPDGDSARVSRITWRAVDPAAGIKPTEFGEFTFSAGPWPADSDTVALPADQKYSDGSSVSWNEIAVDQHTEPEYPAPVVTLAAAQAGHSHDGHGAPEAPGAPDTVTQAAAGVPADSWWWRITSLAALVIAVGTAGLFALSLRRNTGTGSS